jgi:signal transduction histidine kinase/CheY-like chemotaxis protein
VKFRRPDGETAWVVLNAGVIPDRATGAVRGAITVLLDVTERKSVEHRLQGAHRMEALGHLVGGVAHDFNNLLTVILGYSAFLETRLGSEHASHRDAIEIQKAGGRAASLTRQLLAFSRQHPLKPQVLDLNVVIADLGKMLRRLIGEDIELKTVLGSELGHVRADPGQIEQVIVNLVVNARDAMPQGGKLTIETANAALDTQSTGKPPGARPGAYVVLSVTDTGVGMDAVTRARMFEPFFTTKEAGEGAGLGLSTVLAIVQQCGGHLDVRSEPGVGTTFLAYLPQVTERLEAPVDATVPAYVPLGSETVMVVEDDELVRGVLRHALRRAGYSVLEAAGPEEALELFAQQAPQFQLLLADVVMPGMSGPKLVERLRAAGARCKVLYVSGYSEAAALRHGWHDAHGAFLQKPFTPEVLAAKVRELLDAAGEEGLGLGSAARSGDVEEA